MFDIHVHFGQFNEIFFNPDKIINDLIELGLDQIGLMSFISKKGDNILNSHKIMVELAHNYKNFIVPILWIHPATGITTIKQMLNELPYRIIKIHGYLHDWHKHPDKLQKIITISKERNLPIMFHTGGRKESNAYSYKKICKNNPDNRFILAHSRPVKGAINVLRSCPNVYSDTAFMPLHDLKLILKSGFEDRLLFGTDYPIISALNKDIQLDKWHIKIRTELKSEVSDIIFKKITEENFITFFNNQ